MLGGLLFAASDFAARLVVTLDGRGAATSGYALWIALSLLALALLQLALIGLYSPNRQTAGALGWVGFFLASTGIAFAFFVVSIYAFVTLPGLPDDPGLLGAGPPPMFLLYFPLFSMGWFLLGAAFVKVPFYPRWAVRLLALGAVIALHPNPLTTVVFGASVAWLGLALALGDSLSVERSGRPPLRGERSGGAHDETRFGSDALAYFLLGRRAGKGAEERLTLLCQKTSDGERAVLAFEEAAAAEAFRIIDGLGPEWEVVDSSPEVAGVLRGAAAAGRARYVVLDPPSALTRGDEEIKLVPISSFVDHLGGA